MTSEEPNAARGVIVVLSLFPFVDHGCAFIAVS
jgi:hypothetical protein